jgi:hypothetical protein
MQEQVTASDRGGPRVAPTHFLRDWPLVPILVLAVVLRMGWPGLSEFKYDEARLSGLALDWVRGGPLPLAGMTSSTGVSNPPLSVYLLALPYALASSPIVATLFIGLLNVLAVAGCYALARRWYGRTAAWVSALLFAAGPWAILYRANCGRRICSAIRVVVHRGGRVQAGRGPRAWLAVLPAAVAFTVQLRPGVALALWARCCWRCTGGARWPGGAGCAGVVAAAFTAAPSSCEHWMEPRAPRTRCAPRSTARRCTMRG